MIEAVGPKNKNLVLVETYGDPTPVESVQWHVAPGITRQTVCVFDTSTKIYSDNSVYKSSKGLYIKKGGKRYYIGDFK